MLKIQGELKWVLVAKDLRRKIFANAGIPEF